MGMQQSEHTATETRHAPPPEIGGRTWFVTGPGVAKCAIAPGTRPPHEAQVVTPDPRKTGWRIAWIFLGGLVAAFVASPWIAKALGWCAVLVLPFWLWR